MITLTDDEVALIRSLLTVLRGIKIREIDKALVILSKAERITVAQSERITVAQDDRGVKS